VCDDQLHLERRWLATSRGGGRDKRSFLAKDGGGEGGREGGREGRRVQRVCVDER